MILGKPDGGKMTPTKFTEDGVPIILELIPYMNGMVSTLAIILQILFILRDYVGLLDGITTETP